MWVTVTVSNEILGNSVFWQGNAKDIHLIRNVPARELASEVIVDGKTRSVGMWTVSAKPLANKGIK